MRSFFSMLLGLRSIVFSISDNFFITLAKIEVDFLFPILYTVTVDKVADVAQR